MSHDSQQAIMHVLQQDSPVLAGLLGHLKYLADLQQILNGHVEAKLANRCLVTNFDKNTLTVVTTSALWATQFRFQKPLLIEKLKAHPELAEIRDILCKIRPAPHQRVIPTPDQSMPPLSVRSANLIRLAAKTIQHTKLKAIMEKIANNTTLKKG